ncbi:MAG: histidine kinase dimerization/phospho-acceptor domain-containing protein [Caldilineaceae bacterium]
MERHRALAQMVAGVAHELNTPLGIAYTAADMIIKRLQGPQDGGPQRRSLSSVAISIKCVERQRPCSRNLAQAHKLVQNFREDFREPTH